MERGLGRTIWLSTLAIIIIGLTALYSASFQNVRVSNKVFFDQLVCAFVGLGVMYGLSRIDYRKFYDIAYVLYILNIVLLVAVLLAGRHALGAQRWIEIGGISFQPSELTKLAIILALGRYFSQHRRGLSFRYLNRPRLLIRDLVIPLALVIFPMLLIFKQPDLGTALLIFGIFYIMWYASGVNGKLVAWFTGLCVLMVPLGWGILKPYQKDRLLVFLNPNIDPLGAGYTIIQSKIAVGSGQFFGKGWLAGSQNQLNFLPERHTDFIFSVIGEEWGLIGAIVMLTCYVVVIYCGLRIAEQVKDHFGTLVCIGIVGIFALQVIINVGMVLGLCPVVGLTLPLVSYGRTSFMIFAVMMGFLLNLSKRRTVF